MTQLNLDAFDFGAPEASAAVAPVQNVKEIVKEEVKTPLKLVELPKADVRQISWFDQHFYGITKNNETDYYPSVTTILQATPKPYLSRWRGDVGNAEADKELYEAGDRGTRIHLACETLSKGGAVVYNPYDRPVYTPAEIEQIAENHNGLILVLRNQHEYFQVFKAMRFLEEIKPEEMITERMVFSDAYKFAGTMDLILKIKGGKYKVDGAKAVELQSGYYICDWKSSNNFSDDYFMQIAAYAEAYQEQNEGFNFAGGLILHTNSKTRTGIEGFSAKLRTAEELKQDFVDFLKVYEVYKIRPSYTTPKVFDMPSILSIN